MKKYVAGFMFSPDKTEVLLIEKLSPAWQKGFLNAIGGLVEEGEASAEAMAREFEEETGVKTAAAKWLHFATIEIKGDYSVDFYKICSRKISAARTVEREKVVRCAVDNLPSNIVPNLAWLIPLALDEKISFELPVLFREKSAN